MANVNGNLVAKSLVLVAKKVEDNKDYLCALDGEVGDGDHGVSMTIGMRAVSRAAKALPINCTPSEAFQSAADAMQMKWEQQLDHFMKQHLQQQQMQFQVKTI